MSERTRVALFLGGFAATLVAVFALHPAPVHQWLSYHDFADKRSWLGIPNTLNVLSNAAFLLALRRPRRTAAELTFFLGVFATALGSSYYHLDPNNATLPWDRLGMAIAFMALLAILIERRITPRAPLLWLAALETFGIASVIISGVFDDLRLYGVAQYFPILVVAVLIEGWLWAAGAAYGIAKVCEQFDGQIFRDLHGTVSGHTLKHLFAAAGIWFIWRWLRGLAAWRRDGASTAGVTPARRLRSPRADPRGRSPRAGTSPASAA